MRRSISFCEPSQAIAGEANTWKFTHTTAISLPKGAKLRFDLQTRGRLIDWEFPTPKLKDGKNLIYLVMPNNKTVEAKELRLEGSTVPVYDFILPANVAAGESIEIYMGAPGKKVDVKKGNRAQTNSQRRRSFHLYIDPKGKGNFGEAEVFSVDIKGNVLSTIRVLTPSYVVRNKRFDAIVRFEDEYGNLTNTTAEDTLIELSYENLRDTLNWKLFVPETGFLSLPNLYFNEPGVYTIQLKNLKTKEIFRSFPIKCFGETNEHLFWGLLHGESDKIDSTENIESCLRHFRDEKALNFFSSSPFENSEETSNEIWKIITQNIHEFDEADRFTTYLGVQWEGIPGEEGMRQIIYCKDGKTFLRKKDAKFSTLKKIYKTFSPKEIISIPCFTMGKGHDFNFKNYDPEYERVVEIYNSWGSSECLSKEGNPISIKGKGKKGVNETGDGSVLKALMNNCRFGFVAGGLDDRGSYADFYESGQEQYPPGLTAIISVEHSKNALMEALYNRSCYATTGERIIVGLYIAGIPMGKEISTADKPGLMVNRHLTGYVAGTCQLSTVEIIRNGKVLVSFDCSNYFFNFTYDDMTPLQKVSLNAKDNKPPFVFYYLRVTQSDGHMAWSSPIWVDFVTPVAGAKTIKKAVSKSAPVEYFGEEDEEDEEEELDYDLEEEDAE